MKRKRDTKKTSKLSKRKVLSEDIESLLEETLECLLGDTLPSKNEIKMVLNGFSQEIELHKKLSQHLATFSNTRQTRASRGRKPDHLKELFVREIFQSLNALMRKFMEIAEKESINLVCPISKTLITFAVTLKKSNITYDETNLMKSLEFSPTHIKKCPCTNIELPPRTDIRTLFSPNREKNKLLWDFRKMVIRKSDRLFTFLVEANKHYLIEKKELLESAFKIFEKMLEFELDFNLDNVIYLLKRNSNFFFYDIGVIVLREIEKIAEKNKNASDKEKIEITTNKVDFLRDYFVSRQNLSLKEKEFTLDKQLKYATENTQIAGDDEEVINMVKFLIKFYLKNTDEIINAKKKAFTLFNKNSRIFADPTVENYLIKIKVSPNSRVTSGIENELGKLYEENENYEEAEKYFTLSIMHDPENLEKQIIFMDFLQKRTNLTPIELCAKYLLFSKINKKSLGFYLCQCYQLCPQDPEINEKYLTYLLNNNRIDEYLRVSESDQVSKRVAVKKIIEIQKKNSEYEKKIADISTQINKLKQDVEQTQNGNCQFVAKIKVRDLIQNGVYNSSTVKVKSQNWNVRGKREPDGAFSFYLGNTSNNGAHKVIACSTVSVPFANLTGSKTTSGKYVDFTNKSYGIYKVYSSEEELLSNSVVKFRESDEDDEDMSEEEKRKRGKLYVFVSVIINDVKLVRRPGMVFEDDGGW